MSSDESATNLKVFLTFLENSGRFCFITCAVFCWRHNVWMFKKYENSRTSMDMFKNRKDVNNDENATNLTVFWAFLENLACFVLSHMQCFAETIMFGCSEKHASSWNSIDMCKNRKNVNNDEKVRRILRFFVHFWKTLTGYAVSHMPNFVETIIVWLNVICELMKRIGVC